MLILLFRWYGEYSNDITPSFPTFSSLVSQAAISSIGGVIGYVKKGSKPSLIAGVVCGGIYAFSGYLINSNNEQGHDIAAVTSVLLAAVMGARVIK